MMNTTNSLTSHCVALLLGAALLQLQAAPLPVELLEEEARLTLGADVVPNDAFGRVVAIDGERLVATEQTSGTATIFKRTDSRWEVEDTITGEGIRFGTSAAIDGDVIVIGNISAEANGVNFAGAAYVFERRSTGKWELAQKLVSDKPRNPNSMGTSIALSGDTLLIGESGADIRDAQEKLIAQDVGCVHFFSRAQSGRWERKAKYFPNDKSTFQYVGNSLALDGDTFIVGGPQKNVGSTDAAGAVYVFVRRSDGTWGEQATLTAPEANSDAFGHSLALRGDTAVISKFSSKAKKPGIYVFHRTNATWTQQVKLTPGTAGDITRGPVAISESEDVIMAGGSENSVGNVSGAGSITVFVKDANGFWSEKNRLTARAPLQNGAFGNSLAMSGDTIIAGAPNAFNVPGALYVFSVDYAGADAKVADYLRALFYHPSDNAPFRYKVLLYEDNGGLRPASENMPAYFGQRERDRLQNLLLRVETALGANLSSAAYRDLVLDVFYDLTVAEAILARSSLVEIDKVRLDAPSKAGGFVIDDEIMAYEEVLPKLADAIGTHLALLTDPLGSDTVPPLGYMIFKERVPDRKLAPAQYLDGNTLKPVAENGGDPIINGYKDYVLLLDLIGDYGCNAATLAKLYRLVGREEDAKRTVSNAKQFVFLEGSTLRGIFSLNGEDPVAVAEALANWNQAIADLDEVSSSFQSQLNPLGFERDFLVLLNKPQGAVGEFFDTFNILRERLDDLTSNSNPIVRALAQRDLALADYDSYRGNVDELEDRLVDLTSGGKARLLAIVGASYGSAAYDAVPRPGDPANGGYIVGSELWNQFKNIERARIQIDLNSTEIRNLQEKVRIEAERNLFEIETKNAIADLQVEYGELRADVEEEIGKVNAVQAGSEAVKSSLTASNPGAGLIEAGNGVIQVTAELYKGELNAHKEKLAAWEQAEIIGKENQILNADSKALIETWMLDMNTLVLNSQENALVIAQEMGRLVALLREKASLERRIELSRSSLKSRYFANPVHLQRYNQELFVANQKFQDAQEVVFFLARALEYKWNEPFETIMSGKGVSMETIYKVRNASELQSLVDAMELADFQKDGEGAQKESFDDVFSMREDAFGLGSDPAAITSFREEMKSLRTGDPGSDDFVEVVIPFSTVRDSLASLNGRNFFRGPRFRFAGSSNTVLNRGRYLDKIQSFQVTIPGTHTTGANSIPTTMKYSGTSFVRRKAVGQFQPGRPDRLSGEMDSFPTRVSNFESGIWKAGTSLTASPTALLINETPPAGQNVVDVFRERSVACSGWELRIVIKDGVPLLNIDEMDDVRIYFKHTAITRQAN